MEQEIKKLRAKIADRPLDFAANMRLGRLIAEYGKMLDAQQDKELKEIGG